MHCAIILLVLEMVNGFFHCRSIDIWLDNEIERIHALRLVRRLLAISSDKFPRSLFGAILSVACDGARERDRMVSVCLATLCEIGLRCNSIQSLKTLEMDLFCFLWVEKISM